MASAESSLSFVPQFLPEPISTLLLWITFMVPLLVVLAAVGLIAFPAFQDHTPSPAGCTRLGLHERSNISDEMDPKYHQGTPQSDGTWKVKSLLVYPIKSCRGVELERSGVVSTGLRYDRQFTFAQLKSPFPVSQADSTEKKASHEWKFATQREFPLMSQVKTELWIPDPKKSNYKPDLPYVRTGGAIVLTFPWQETGLRGTLASAVAKMQGTVPTKSFTIPFAPTDEQIERDYMQERVTIWKETVTATNMGLHVPPELKYFLGIRNPFTLFRINNYREVFRTAPRKEKLGWQPITAFADAFPIHLMGVASMQELSHSQAPGSPSLSVRRFRPNIVIEGPPPYEEEKWKKISLGKDKFIVTCRCVRCLLPNVDPESGIRHGSEPNRTLRAIRNVDPGAPLAGCLGMNVVPAAEEGFVSVGDEIKVYEEGDHVYIPQ
jgi:uncharacterized protein YcbX